MNSSLLPSTSNSNSCMERYVNRYVVHQQSGPSHHHPVHSQHPGSPSVAASVVATGYFHQPGNIHPHQQHHSQNHHPQQQQQSHQNQFLTLATHNRSGQHSSPSVSATPAAHPAGGASGHGASSNYMVGCYGAGGVGGASGWTGVPLISTASNNRRQRKHFSGSGTANNGNHYPYQQYLAQQQHYNLTKGTSSGPEFDENANLTRLALHAQGAPLILSTNRYHHGHHRNHKSSSSAAPQTSGCGVGSAKAVTSGGSQIQSESSTNCSTRSATQLSHPGLGCNGGQRRPLDGHHAAPMGAGGQSSDAIKSYESVASLELIPSSGNTSSPATVMSGSAMSSSVSSASSASSSASSSSTEMCLPRIIKPRKRRKKDRKPNTQTLSAANGGVGSAGSVAEGGVCVPSDGGTSGCSSASAVPCMESHLLNVAAGNSIQAMNNIMLQHQQSQLQYGPASMEPVGGVPNVRDILNELSYIVSQNPSLQQQQYSTHEHLSHHPQQTQDHQLVHLNTAFCNVNSPGSESGDSGNASLRSQTTASGLYFPSTDLNGVVVDSVQEQESSSTSSSYSTSIALPEPTSPSVSSNCSCRLCDPFGRIWAFPMLRQTSCSSAEGFEPEERKKNVGVIGSNRNGAGAAARGKWCTSTGSAPFATISIGDSADECLSRKGSFSDSGSDSGCDLLLSRLPGLCSTEEEEEEEDEEEDNGDRGGGCASEVEKSSDSLLASLQSKDSFAENYRNLPWLSSIVGHPVVSTEASFCARKTNDDELLLMSELTKKLHETLDLDGVGEPCAKDGAGAMAPRSGSCSSSSSSSSSTSDNSSGMGSLLGGDFPSTASPSNVFASYDIAQRSTENRLLTSGDRLFDPRAECLVIDGSSDVCASEMLHMVSMKKRTGSSQGEEKGAGLVGVGNGGSGPEENGIVLRESGDFVQCEKRNPLSLRPISVVSSLFSVNQQGSAASSGRGWIGNGAGTGGSSNFLFGSDQQQQEHVGSFLLPAELQDHPQRYRQPSDGVSVGDMLNCFDTVWSGGDHKSLRP
uniref:Uncharacterized protein n=1 Tax=Anopheles epiroticus TaxID=199890 RepID=A0A182PLG7_9DIPT